MTAITDTFNRADSTTTLGNTETGQPWQTLNGSTWGIAGGKAYNVGNTSDAFAVVDVGSADMSVGATGVDMLVARVTDANNCLIWYKNALWVRTGGAVNFTNIATGNASYGAGDAIRLDITGTTGTLWKNGVQVATFTNSSTGTKAGLRADTKTARFDKFTLNALGATSAPPTSTPTPSTLGNNAAPPITGTPTVGQTLTALPGSWSAAPDSYTYQWTRASIAIAGATSRTYIPVTADASNALTVAVTAVKSGYTSCTGTSAATTPVALARYINVGGTAVPVS